MERLAVEYIGVGELVPYERNARTHSDEQVALIADAIEEFGWTNPILIDEQNGIIAGHGRLLAAQRLGMEEVPCVRLGNLTEAQRRAYIIADNALAERAGWDEELLRLEIGWLQEHEFDLGLIGLDDALLEGLLAPDYGDDEQAAAEEVPETPENPVAVEGDLWVLGEHRLICGDSTRADVVERLLNGNDVSVALIDPPFENGRLYKELSQISANFGAETLICFLAYNGLRDVSEIILEYNHCYEFIWDGITSWFTPNRPLARHKTAICLSQSPQWDFDKSIYFDGKAREEKQVKNTRGSYEYSPIGRGFVHLQTVFSSPNTRVEGDHPHAKPVAWLGALLGGVGGNTVFDPFAGSGSGLVASCVAGRRWFGVELNPAYIDVIIKRWQDFTGGQATLEGDGRTFDEVARQRLGEAEGGVDAEMAH